MAQTTFEVDAATLAAIAELKQKFGVKTNAQVIRKALALARVAAQNADEENALTIVSPHDGQKKVLLTG
jgi:ribosomal protein L7/L12